MEPLYGVLDLLVLRTLLFGPLHGYAIAGAIRDSSGEALKIEFGSLYLALKRLELKGWITSKWETSYHNRRAKVYRLTPAGRKRLAHET
jgi:PadR family transcriptional regulator